MARVPVAAAAFVCAVSSLSLGMVAHAQSMEPDLPEGCKRLDAKSVTCDWSRPVDVTQYEWGWDIDGIDGLQVIEVQLRPSSGDPMVWALFDENGTRLGQGGHGPGNPDGVGQVVGSFGPGGGFLYAGFTVGIHQSNYLHLVVTFDLVVGTNVPDAAAGSPSDPQILDAMGDAPGPRFMDLAGAWFNDAVLDDGIFEVGFVVPHLREYETYGFGSEEQFRLRINWTLLGHQYTVDASYFPDNPAWSLLVVNADTWSGFVYRDGQLEVYTAPIVDAEAGLVVLRLPLATVGSPPGDAIFERLSANSRLGHARSLGTPELPTVFVPADLGRYDHAANATRPFALGGPEIWLTLRGEASPTPANVAWYQDPLAAENLPNTLQVLAVPIAVLGSLWGALLVSRRRRTYRRHLATIEAAAARPPAQAVAALARLEREFVGLLEDGHMDERMHEALSSRLDRAEVRVRRAMDGKAARAA